MHTTRDLFSKNIIGIHPNSGLVVEISLFAVGYGENNYFPPISFNKN